MLRNAFENKKSREGQTPSQQAAAARSAAWQGMPWHKKQREAAGKAPAAPTPK